MKRLVCLLALVLAGCFDLDRLRAPAGDDGGMLGDLSGPVTRCPSLGAQLCDGFEGPVIDPGHWTRIEHGGSLAIDSTRAYRGLQSLAVTADAVTSGDVQAEITESETFPSADIFMRAFVYLPDTTPATAIRLMTPYQVAPPYDGVSLSARPTSGGFAPRVFDGVTGVTLDTMMASFPTGQWVCLELEVAQGNPGQVHVWVDDVEYGDLASTADTSTTPPFGVLSFGLLHPAGGVAHTLWIDEVAVDNKRISCSD
jgi:hypothetical protein